MAGKFAKEFDQVIPEVREAYLKAFASPGKLIIVREHASLEIAQWLHTKLKQARAGFLVYLPKEHEYYRAAACERLHINRQYTPKAPEFRTVTLLYDGMIKRPSEEAAEWLANLTKNQQSTPE